jgi:hypothetical protein
MRKFAKNRNQLVQREFVRIVSAMSRRSLKQHSLKTSSNFSRISLTIASFMISSLVVLAFLTIVHTSSFSLLATRAVHVTPISVLMDETTWTSSLHSYIALFIHQYISQPCLLSVEYQEFRCVYSLLIRTWMKYEILNMRIRKIEVNIRMLHLMILNKDLNNKFAFS